MKRRTLYLCVSIIFLALLIVLFNSCYHIYSSTVTITWAAGKDVTGTPQRLAGEFMARNPGYVIKLIEMPGAASLQRDSYAAWLMARDPEIDVYALDMIWPAEFAAAGWIIPLDKYFPEEEQEQFFSGPLEGCRYKGKVYAVPWFTDIGLLYYRKDLLAREGFSPPRTWAELVRQAEALRDKYRINGFVFPAARYEGLICNFLEFLWSFGGETNGPPDRLMIDTPDARAALAFLYDLIYWNRVAPREVLAFKEEESMQVFTSGRSAFLRSWPYAWKAAQDTNASKVAGAVGIARLPGEVPGGGVSCLGGWNLAISKYSRHPPEAWKFVEFMTGAAAQKENFILGGRFPARRAVFQDKDVRASAPYIAELYPAFASARHRPVTPAYSKVSGILQEEIHRALTRRQSIETALKNAQSRIEK